jgi:hypothetical protein
MMDEMRKFKLSIVVQNHHDSLGNYFLKSGNVQLLLLLLLLHTPHTLGNHGTWQCHGVGENSNCQLWCETIMTHWGIIFFKSGNVQLLLLLLLFHTFGNQGTWQFHGG